MDKSQVTDEKIVSKIHELIDACGGGINTFEAELITQQIQTSLRFLSEGHNTGQLKLITRALKEMRYAYRIFNDYPDVNRISIFGSARTPEDHPDYKAAEFFSKELSRHGWMSITGAANGIMKAGMSGASPNGTFGLSIRLPFEVPTNTFIEGDPKLIHFRYFFTRKLMFMSHSDAIAAFPGGVGTMDEVFEILTLMQTGKGAIIPVVLLEGAGGEYWYYWERYVRKNLLGNGWISPEDMSFFHISPSIEEAVKHILHFYHRYHSSRYVKENFVIRLKSPLTEESVEALNDEFPMIIKSGKMYLRGPLPEENEYPDLPRLVFNHTRDKFGVIRQLIDRINQLN